MAAAVPSEQPLLRGRRRSPPQSIAKLCRSPAGTRARLYRAALILRRSIMRREHFARALKSALHNQAPRDNWRPGACVAAMRGLLAGLFRSLRCSGLPWRTI
jgi:hypothetical protein